MKAAPGIIEMEITVAPLGRIAGEVLTGFVGGLERIFPFRFRIAGGIRELEFAYDGTRRQYSAIELLKALHRFGREDGSKVIGLTDVDLFVPVLTFVYGQAQMDGMYAVVSTYRLALDKPGGLILLSRLIKEGAHELFHTFGLVHCGNSLCVMNLSHKISQVDVKEASPCAECLETLTMKFKTLS
ncbi:MAG: hypothetical protein FJ088_00740 [Deltaproteobacteria bacterium]|nr:hypothetical protein [Deltaproteobacteria bacterium]